MHPGTSNDAVRLRRFFSAIPQLVYDAWLDPAILAQWMSPVGHALVAVDARPGGRFRVVMVGDGREIEHVGRYRELIPPSRLVFTWSSPYTGGDSIVTVELTPVHAGTELTLIHERLPADQVAPHTGGWATMLERLASVLSSAALKQPMGDS